MELKHGFACAVVSLILAACYVEPAIDHSVTERQSAAATKDGDQRKDPSLCHFSLESGCFDGYLAIKQNFTVNGQQFFNADDFANRFREVINSKEDDALISVVTPIDNQSFYQDFTYDLTGGVARSGALKGRSNFSLSFLPEGHYDLRVQRPLHFTLSSKQLQEGESAVKHFCATLYSDTALDIRNGERQSQAINEFKLYVTDHACQQKPDSPKLSSF
jgi:hypothetical protein